MPQAELLTTDWREEFRKFQAERARLRTPGRHLSEIVSRIVKKTEPGRYPDGPIDPALAQQGFIWEDVLSWVFTRQFGRMKQIETEVDGIIMTLDGLRLPGKSNPGLTMPRVFEAKATKMSAANPITSRKFQPWMLRTSGYCVAFDTFEAEILVLFINGSYELGGGRFGATVAKGWVLKFSKIERQENWDWIRRERDEMDREGL